jgi:hypothetical protein
MASRFRGPFGIFEAAILLTVAGMVLWIVRPLPGADGAAAEERSVMKAMGAVADHLEARKPPFLRLDRLGALPALAGWTPSAVPGVYGRGSFWMAVLLPGRDGWLCAPGEEVPSEAGRGYCVVAWPKKEAADVLRAVAALPGKAMWQRTDGMEESGDPARPPVPRVAFPAAGAPLRSPGAPPDWTPGKSRP